MITYKLWDIISTEWLVPFECKTCKELWLKEGDLVVVIMADSYYKEWEIIELIKDDDSTCSYFSNREKNHHMYICEVAPLPTTKVKKEELPVYETIIRRNDWLEFKKGMIGEETIEQITARRKSLLQDANKITGLLKKYNSITF